MYRLLEITPFPLKKETERINEAIRAHELRVIDHNGANLGVISLDDALARAREAGLDLIEISPDAIPPVAKITDYGKFQYSQSKKQKEIKAKTQTSEVKNIQIKIATSEGDLAVKAKKASEWLAEGHRIKVELFVRGRSKYMDKKFLRDRLDRVLALISVDHKVVEDFRESPKGFSVVIERIKK